PDVRPTKEGSGGSRGTRRTAVTLSALSRPWLFSGRARGQTWRGSVTGFVLDRCARKGGK
ncbi:unnamed protein product, partial [Ectocarpus sp. 4 AP-2014]